MSEELENKTNLEWLQEMLLDDINSALSKLENPKHEDTHPSVLLKSYLSSINIHFEGLAHETGLGVYAEIEKKSNLLTSILLEKIAAFNIESHKKSMAYGEVVEVLKHYKLPKQNSRDDLANWAKLKDNQAKISGRAIRKYNEEYRKHHGEITSNIETRIMLSPYADYVVKNILSNDIPFPSAHANATKALQKTRELYSSSQEKWQRLKKQ